jgi:hypothetical protein
MKSISFFLLKDHIQVLNKVGAMLSASYVGGGVNFCSHGSKVLSTWGNGVFRRGRRQFNDGGLFHRSDDDSGLELFRKAL